MAATVIRNVTIACYYHIACNVILRVQGLEYAVATATDKNFSFLPGVYPTKFGKVQYESSVCYWHLWDDIIPNKIFDPGR